MSDFFLEIVFYAREGQQAGLRMDLQALAEASRKDEGCKRYDLFADQADAKLHGRVVSTVGGHAPPKSQTGQGASGVLAS